MKHKAKKKKRWSEPKVKKVENQKQVFFSCTKADIQCPSTLAS